MEDNKKWKPYTQKRGWETFCCLCSRIYVRLCYLMYFGNVAVSLLKFPLITEKHPIRGLERQSSSQQGLQVRIIKQLPASLVNLLFHALHLMDIICFQHLLLTYNSFQRSFLSSGFLAICRMIQCGISAATTTFRSIKHLGTGLSMQANDTGNS